MIQDHENDSNDNPRTKTIKTKDQIVANTSVTVNVNRINMDDPKDENTITGNHADKITKIR